MTNIDTVVIIIVTEDYVRTVSGTKYFQKMTSDLVTLHFWVDTLIHIEKILNSRNSPVTSLPTEGKSGS